MKAMLSAFFTVTVPKFAAALHVPVLILQAALAIGALLAVYLGASLVVHLVFIAFVTVVAVALVTSLLSSKVPLTSAGVMAFASGKVTQLVAAMHMPALGVTLGLMLAHLLVTFTAPSLALPTLMAAVGTGSLSAVTGIASNLVARLEAAILPIAVVAPAA